MTFCNAKKLLENNFYLARSIHAKEEIMLLIMLTNTCCYTIKKIINPVGDNH